MSVAGGLSEKRGPRRKGSLCRGYLKREGMSDAQIHDRGWAAGVGRTFPVSRFAVAWRILLQAALASIVINQDRTQ